MFKAATEPPPIRKLIIRVQVLACQRRESIHSLGHTRERCAAVGSEQERRRCSNPGQVPDQINSGRSERDDVSGAVLRSLAWYAPQPPLQIDLAPLSLQHLRAPLAGDRKSVV